MTVNRKTSTLVNASFTASSLPGWMMAMINFTMGSRIECGGLDAVYGNESDANEKSRPASAT